MEVHCGCCGKEVEQNPGRKKKKFCSDRCRLSYWHGHRDVERQGYREKVCGNCGQVFESYGRAGQIYCSHACYREMRFVKKGVAVVRRRQPEHVEIKELPHAPALQGAEVAQVKRVVPKRAVIALGAGDFPEPKRIWLVCGATMFSGKIDHFASHIPPELSERLMAEDAFVFCNRRRDLLSLLQWQGDGFALYYKRLEYGQYPWPKIQKGKKIVEISPRDFGLLLVFPDFVMRCERGDFSPLEMMKKPEAQMLF